MKKFTTSIIVALALCALMAFAGCGILNKSVSGQYVVESIGGQTLDELSSQYDMDLNDDFIRLTLKDNGDIKYTMDVPGNYGTRDTGSGSGTYQLDGSDITLNFIDKRDGITDTTNLRGVMHGHVQGNKIVIEENGEEMVFVRK